MQKTLPAVLTPQEFAQLLQVGIKAPEPYMRELPHLNCEQRLNGQYRTCVSPRGSRGVPSG